VGLGIDGNLRVLYPCGLSIPSLYAVGDVSGRCRTGGDLVNNGGALTSALTFCYLLETNLLKFQA
jgi:hypothetical protein